MKYEKPKVVAFASALTAVRGVSGKGGGPHWDNFPNTPMTLSIPAYEADE